MVKLVNLFVYGVLTFPEIVHALTGKSFKSEKAKLKDYSVKAVIDKPYPGLINDPNNIADGMIIYNTDEASLNIIQKWEGSEYILKNVQVIVGDDKIKAVTFLWKGPKKLKGSWDRELFKIKHLPRYLNVDIPKYLAKQ